MRPAETLCCLAESTAQTGNSSNQTWIWDGSNWHQLQPAMSPPARWGHAMAYDSATQTTILFGGYGEYGDSNDTWSWDGTNWTQITSAASPLPRDGHAMAFDAMRGQVVLFGGALSGNVPTFYSDTWLYDATGWHQALTPTPPAARFGETLAYHPALHSVVMIGGYGGKDVTDTSWNYDFHKETWLWNGEAWAQQFPENQPGPAYTVVAAYDDTKQALTVHVGDDLTCLSRGPKTYLLTANQGTLGSMPQIASAGGWETTLTLVNLSSSPSGAQLNLIGNDGSASTLPFTFPQQPPQSAILTATWDQTLDPNAMLVLDTTGPVTQAATAGWSQLFHQRRHQRLRNVSRAPLTTRKRWSRWKHATPVPICSPSIIRGKSLPVLPSLTWPLRLPASAQLFATIPAHRSGREQSPYRRRDITPSC